MPVSTSAHIQNAKIGTCPHGLPQGACPVCNGSAGGNSTTKRDIPRNAGEMTYNQCAAIGAIIMANKAAQKKAQTTEQNRLQGLIDFQKNLQAVHQRIMNLTFVISKSFPAIIAKPINFVLNQFVGRFVQIIINIPNVFSNIIQKFADISEKLNAIYGESKAAIQKTVSDFWQRTKKKLKSIFFVFGADESDNEEKKIDEAKKIFHLKTFIHKLSQKLKGEEKIDKN